MSDGFWQALEQVKVAEEVGFSHVFSVEHHFLDQFSVASAPEVWLAAVAQHTSKIRIGHGVRLLPFNYTIPSGRRRWLRRSKPVQRPHPPIWMSGTQPESAVLAGERGIGFMHFSLSDPFRDGREGALLPGHALAIYFMHYNFVRIHQTLRCTPAMEVGVTDKLWSLDDMAALVEASEESASDVTRKGWTKRKAG